MVLMFILKRANCDRWNIYTQDKNPFLIGNKEYTVYDLELHNKWIPTGEGIVTTVWYEWHMTDLITMTHMEEH